MTNSLVSILFTDQVNNEINIIFNSDFVNYQRSKIRLQDDTYYFIKVSSEAIVFASLTYNMFCEKGYLQPIALIYQNFETFLFPTLVSDYISQHYISNLKILKLENKESLVAIIGSLEMVNLLYANKSQLINGETLIVEVEEIKFTVTDLFNCSFNFHIENGNIQVASYEYSIETETNHLILDELIFFNEFSQISQIVGRNKFLVFNNVVS